MSQGSFEVTSADNESEVPAGGFAPGGNFRLDILGGSSINGELRIRKQDGSYIKLPSVNNLTNFSQPVSLVINASADDVFKLYIQNASGTWEVTHKTVST